ncbi:MAG TPA: hypothetical protein VGP25_10255 [Gemmatimonadaceae bacterium]|nr:hypothetical protein [Gemmatimonadaceae bacterium]
MSARLADILDRCIPSVLDAWGRRARAGELAQLCEADRVGELGSVLRAMASALRPPSEGSGAVDEFIETAAAHGAHRRAQGVGESCLFEEYDLLGSTLPLALRTCPDAPMLSPEELVSLEGGLTTAILAGLRGFHRGEFERRGAWPETLARAVSEASEMGRRGEGRGRQA